MSLNVFQPLFGSSGSASSDAYAGILDNVGIDASVAANALTIALKQKDGSTDPATSTGAVKVNFRNTTATSGGYTQLSQTSALSLTVPSGATLGHASATSNYIYIYVLNNSGAIELAVSSNRFDEGSLVSTTILNTSSDDFSTIYSTTARSSVPIRLIGRMISNQTTAGTWAAAPTEESSLPFHIPTQRHEVRVDTSLGNGSTGVRIKVYQNTQVNVGSAITYTSSAVNGDSFTINQNGEYAISMSATASAGDDFGISRNASTTTAVGSLAVGERLCIIGSNGSSPINCSWTGWLFAGDIIRAHQGGTTVGNTAQNSFQIVKVV